MPLPRSVAVAEAGLGPRVLLPAAGYEDDRTILAEDGLMAAGAALMMSEPVERFPMPRSAFASESSAGAARFEGAAARR